VVLLAAALSFANLAVVGTLAWVRTPCVA